MAMGLPLPPFELDYVGHDADSHTVDAIYLGQSLQGTARLYNSIASWHFRSDILSTAMQDIRVHVGPVREGSLFYLVYLMMVHGKLAVYPELLSELAKLAIPAVIKAVIARRSGQTRFMEKQLEAIMELARENSTFARQVHGDHVGTERRLIRVVERLAEVNRKPLADMSAPVGRTVRQIQHFKSLPEPVVIDEPTAEALRSPEGAVVGELERYSGLLKMIDTVTGACKILLDDNAKPIRGKITDPVLAQPENVYTHALDTQRHVTVTAKPVIKNGKISTLYVSDAQVD